MPGPRPVPYVGMPVRIVHLGAVEAGVVDEVLDGGRRLVVGADVYELRQLTGHFVRVGEPWYGTRLALGRDPS